jgi:adenylate cyclase
MFGLMEVLRSPEIEAVVRRIVVAWDEGDADTISNLFSNDPSLRVLGTDSDERWVGHEEFLRIFKTQQHEMHDWKVSTDRVEAFQDGRFGWAVVYATLTTQETHTQIRHMATLRLEAGAWRVLQWQNSIPVSNEQLFGVALTTTLDDLMTSVLRDDAQLASAAGSEGTLTLVFTDMVDSTPEAEAMGDVPWAEVVALHEGAIRHITETEGGTVVKLLGDGSMLAFESARAAVRAAVEIQKASAQSDLVIRIGIHTGEVVRTADDLLGLTVNKAVRVAAAAGPAEILLSATTKDLVGSMPEIRTGEPKVIALKGLSGVHQVVPIEWG